MIYKNVELHNVAQVRKFGDGPGVRLQRIPERVRRNLSPRGQEKMLEPASAEIRFLCDGSSAQVSLSSQGITDLQLFHGPFQTTTTFRITQDMETIEVSMPPALTSLPERFRKSIPFSPEVYRLVMGGPNRSPIVFHGARGENLRPPGKENLPSKRYLAYGTSITHGAHATGAHLSYASQTATRLGVDLINLGSGGSAFCEKEMADYIAGREDWDFVTLSLSVNMIGGGFSVREFRDRVSYMIETIAGNNSKRPVVCITILPHVRDILPGFPTAVEKATAGQFRQQLREAVAGCDKGRVHLVEGSDLLTGIGGLTPDLVHPGDNGMIMIGENLAGKLSKILESEHQDEDSSGE